jgi:hypothetical protein
MSELVKKIQDLCILLAKARAEYAKLPELIEDEHDAIVNSDLDRVENIARTKLLIGQEIEQKVFSVQRLSFQIAEDLGKTSKDIKGISDLVLFLTQGDWFTSQSEDVKKSIQLLNSEVEQFLVLKDSITRPLSVNRLVLSKVLAQRQENYAFWQSITADTFAPYNSRGVPSNQRQSYGFKAKA